ncbi:tRNA lysidine(34) synthetase TilS [Microlunatus parietis]|uniref:tRNA(Ile)-lysidine synthase n=1 Tax=Microlunatus parietis TaxID=682979 RepID=A0A7Y9I9Y1_9ACTN|nr:tRNA lysidine(34) synthetase TilS [Microlunatus parietis]NYE73046.1 tRNA(Ile)-lysidine synthase [Microlunatus parietis]
MAVKALGPAQLEVVQAITRALTDVDHGLLVACSGGPDSLALSVGAHQVARRTGRPLTAVIIDHGLQDGSGQVAERVHDQLSGYGLSAVEVIKVEVARDSGDGPEAAARTARYRALDEAADRLGATTILLGHTRDDQAETVLLGLARGSGTRSLAGMASRSGRLVRPLLELPRATTEQACAEAGLTPWRDPHNADPAYARVRVRDRVLPVLETELGPGIAAALARTARLARDDADLLDELAERAAAEVRTGDGLECAGTLALPAALRARVLRSWLQERGAREVSAERLAEVTRLVTDWHGQAGIDLPGVTVTRREGRLITCGRLGDRG